MEAHLIVAADEKLIGGRAVIGRRYREEEGMCRRSIHIINVSCVPFGYSRFGRRIFGPRREDGKEGALFDIYQQAGAISIVRSVSRRMNCNCGAQDGVVLQCSPALKSPN